MDRIDKQEVEFIIDISRWELFKHSVIYNYNFERAENPEKAITKTV
jgi:hypothetical protein